ncbi:glycoside hydrolase family 32 protein [Galbibacter sp. BG1]|nr:glycoside hydrolase family 32 protein [Galbibacter sp. BG1]
MKFLGILGLVLLVGCKENQSKQTETEVEVLFSDSTEVRPNFHFTPPSGWMNDPNGLVYNDGTYHLFYQHYPDSIVWGPMHWGHATSEDLLNWENKPIAIYPDSLGYIFSGSAVFDKNNTSGLGAKETPPLVAMFTYHDPIGEKEGANNYQTQGIAYSTDNGKSWKKYKGNPVVGNDNMKDFRDPKVFWNEETKNWILLLVAGDHLKIYNSNNLIDWKLLSEFGREKGSHVGVWECPDLFKLKVGETDEEKWVLLISVNAGGPNRGSATQYFVGDFDGEKFTSAQKDTRWLGWGADNYAGVTYNNVPDNKRIFIGWMNNWMYGQETPTSTWRSAMTLPRELSLSKINDEYTLMNYPVEGLNSLREEITIGKKEDGITAKTFNQTEIAINVSKKDFELNFSNTLKDTLKLALHKGVFTVDRSKSGLTGFNESFADKIHQMPVPDLPDGTYEIRLIIDVSSVEIFINGGQYVMTEQIFPRTPYTKISTRNISFKNSKIFKLKSTKPNYE